MEEARKSSVYRTIHAGEVSGPASIERVCFIFIFFKFIFRVFHSPLHPTGPPNSQFNHQGAKMGEWPKQLSRNET